MLEEAADFVPWLSVERMLIIRVRRRQVVQVRRQRIRRHRQRRRRGHYYGRGQLRRVVPIVRRCDLIGHFLW